MSTHVGFMNVDDMYNNILNEMNEDTDITNEVETERVQYIVVMDGKIVFLVRQINI